MEYIIGAYTSAPSLVGESKENETYFYELLFDRLSDIKGLEIPFFGESIHQFGDEYLIDLLNADWNNVITAIPATFEALKKNKHFGLASDDEDSRKSAIKVHKKLNKILQKINDTKGRQAISAVQIATAPSVPKKDISSSSESFIKSFEEMLLWDWDGADLLIEHCDSSQKNHLYQKGFFSIEKEVEILDSFQDTNIGLVLNWARSAIEGQDVKTVIEHINIAQEKDLLKGFIFSGTCINDKTYGNWSDSHMPFANPYDIRHYERNSLLNIPNAEHSLKAIDMNSVEYLGIKLQALPQESATIYRRVGINEDAVVLLNKALNNL